MFKINKKTILISSLVLGIMWLLYSLFIPRPEMIIDKNLRVSEELNPELERMINKTTGFRTNTPTQIVSTKQQSHENEGLVSAMEDSLKFTDDSSVDTLPVFVDVKNVDASQGDTTQPQDLMVGSVKDVINSEQTSPPVNPFKANVVVQSPSSDSDVPLLADTDGFIDLNLSEKKPVDLVLLEGDEIIIDDVNEKLGKFRSTANDLPEIKEVLAPNSTSSLDINTNVQLIQSKEAPSHQATVVIFPEPDESLMSGTDKISLEYQASFKKLKLATEKLQSANEDNTTLKGKFTGIANENRKLAQIIRDIDEEIKVLTAAN